MESSVHGIVVHLHPVAAFSIVDSHERRPKESQTRVIGSLLGVKNEGIYEISSAYPVPHNETDEEVAIDMIYEQKMYSLHQTINPMDIVLGWYATNATIKMHSVLIHDYYSKRDPPPVYLTFDCKLKTGQLDIKAYIRCPVGLPDKTQGVIFSPVPVEIIYFDPERVGISLLNQTVSKDDGNTTAIMNDLERFKDILEDMEEAVDRLLVYVKKVIDGAIPPDSKIGRLLMELVAKVPRLDSAQFDKIMNSTMQDLLMIVYLANLTQTQLELGEKVTHICTPPK